MPTAQSVLKELESKGKESARKTYARHGMAENRTLGASTADMKTAAKAIKGQQTLALDLYATGKMEAMYVAGIVANGKLMTPAQLQTWAEQAEGLPMIFEYTVPWVTVEHADGRKLALKWIESDQEHVAAAGWRTYVGLVTTLPDDQLDLAEVEGLLKRVTTEIAGAKNRVKSTMNAFVIAVGSYVQPLKNKALAAAKKIGVVEVDVGDTACEVPSAAAYIAKVEAAGKLGQKRKTIRC
jgi:3-methyladenine DNA glycosylase AlkD